MGCGASKAAYPTPAADAAPAPAAAAVPPAPLVKPATKSSLSAAGNLVRMAAASENAAYLFVTLKVKADHDMASKMPPTADEFVEVLKGGAQPCFVGADDEGLTCTAAQQALLGPLCEAYNAAKSAQARFDLINKYMLDAVTAEVEAGAQTVDGIEYVVSSYEMKPGPSEGSVYLLEDYPNGPVAHGRTLAVGVFRWSRFAAKLIDAKVERFKTAEERDAAIPA